jgi:hypothetical protein
MPNQNVITGYNNVPIGTSGMYVQMDGGMLLEEAMRISGNAQITESNNTITVNDNGYTKVVTINDDGSEISEQLSYGSEILQTKYIHINANGITIDEIAPNANDEISSGGDGE